MQWSDAAIVLSTLKYGETSAVVRVLARDHGVFAGVVRGANSKNNRGIIQAGNVVSAHWQARLSQQLGSFKLELLEAHAAYLMQDAAKLSALSSACMLIEMALPERHPYSKLFSTLHELLHTLTARDDWWKNYIKFELSLLAESGFGLDLNECAATGKTDNLIYVSPKSGRAVCAEAGLPYHGKMLKLPQFLLNDKSLNHEQNEDFLQLQLQEILAGIELTGYFLEHWLFAPHGRAMPAARKRLQIIIEKLNKKENAP